MPRKARILPRARQDLLNIWAYIAEQNEKVADSMLDRIEGRVDSLLEFPELGRSRPELGRNLRSLVVDSYVVFYMSSGDDIDIVRVLSGYLDIENMDFPGRT